MRNFIVKFTPSGAPVFVYEVEAEDEAVAEQKALDDFRMDVGYALSKDFECIGAEEIDD